MPSVFVVGGSQVNVAEPVATACTATLKAGNDALALPSLTLMTTFAVVPTSAGPGVVLKSETIGLGVMLELPLLVLDIQRAGPSTGMPTKPEQADLLMVLFGRNSESPVPVLAPATPSDCFDVAIEAARIALTYRTPVLAVPVAGAVRAVDRHGVLLPKSARTEGLPVFKEKAAPPTGPAGTRWGDEAVERAAAEQS